MLDKPYCSPVRMHLQASKYTWYLITFARHLQITRLTDSVLHLQVIRGAKVNRIPDQVICLSLQMISIVVSKSFKSFELEQVCKVAFALRVHSCRTLLPHALLPRPVPSLPRPRLLSDIHTTQNANN